MGSLKGVETYEDPEPMQRSSMRSSWMIPEGIISSYVIECVVVDVNMVRWTVDCLSKFDQRRFLDVQVSSPYMHPNSGEGIYIVPEIGSKCYICIPSDGPPPFVLAFVMPPEQISDTSEEIPDAEDPDVAYRGSMTFKGGRDRQKIGDIHMRGRDGNFCILHRGGVMQIGSTQLAQRIFIPINNVVTDISQNYHHYNTAGAVNWGVKIGPSETNPPTFYKQTFRLFANEEEASIRVALGTFSDVIGEPPESQFGKQSDLEQLDIGTDEPIVCEIGLSPEHFKANSGDLTPETRDDTKLRFMFDKNGGTFLRCEGSIMLATRNKFRLIAQEDIYIESLNGGIVLKAAQGVRVESGAVLELTAEGSPGTLVLNAGTKPIATVGSQVMFTTVVPIPIVVAGAPGEITAGAVFTATVSTGNPTIHG
jgi:hypothetical protein